MTTPSTTTLTAATPAINTRAQVTTSPVLAHAPQSPRRS
jgi:hypothetical protein